jgi:hypothetical protein
VNAEPVAEEVAEPKVTGWDIEPTEAVETAPEHVEWATIQELRADVEELSRILRRIGNINPSTITLGGPGNKHFGKKIIVALERAKHEALHAHQAQQVRDLQRIQRLEQDQDGTAEPADES